MKYIGLISVLLIVLLLLVAAVTAILIRPNTSEKAAPSTRITLKAETTINQHGYRIIEVDSVEYICSPNGICPLVKK